MLPLESTLTPHPPRRGDRIVQPGLDEDSMDGLMADGRDALRPIVSQVTFDLVRSPTFASSQFQDQVDGFLRGLVVSVRSSGFDS